MASVHDLPLSDSCSQPYPLASGGRPGRLRYANPEDLPSYPSLGLRKDDAAAGAAASLGWANTRPLSLWTPEKDASAQRAATLANGHTMPAPAPWQPDRSSPGSMAAAVLAAKNASRPENRASMPASVWGSSAATQAFAASGGRGVEPREPVGPLERQKSLRAARQAVAGSGRPRSTSSPQTYPDSANAATNALSAATIAHRPTINIRMEDAGALPVTTMGREMYTSNPPLKSQVDERNRDAVLHASAVAMAKRMYAHQQTAVDKAKLAQDHHEAASSRPASPGTDAVPQPVQFTNLQEAAYNLAQERLARLHEEHQRNRDIAEYYGTSPTTPSTPGRRLTKLGKLRRRASSDGDVTAALAQDDRQQSRQIRKQMSLFSTRLDEVDEAKRAQDREALINTAKRNVRATMESMDERMHRETGRVMPAKLNEWELKAHAAAQARSDARLAGDMTGKVDLGAGAYMDRDQVDEIAARRVQPVLDEINEKAELERQRIAALREEQEKKRLEREGERARSAEVKENSRKLKEEERLRREGLRQEARDWKEEEKAVRAEEKRLAKVGRDNPKATPGTLLDGPAYDTLEKRPEETTHHRHRLHRPFTPKIQTKTSIPKGDTAVLSPESSPESASNSPSTRVKNWLKSRLHRPRAKSVSVSQKSDKQPAGGFIGGHALTSRHADGTGSMTSLSESGMRSMREVALAGRPFSALPLRRVEGGGTGGGSVSGTADSMSSVSSEENNSRTVSGGEARARTKAAVPPPLDLTLTPPRALADPARITPRSSGSPSRDSKFIEDIE